MSMLGWKQRVSKKTINYGLEMEGYGLRRDIACKKVSCKIGDGSIHHESHLDTYFCYDRQGRKWSFCYDSSIHGRNYEDNESLKCEVVTPILTSADIPLLETVIETVRENGLEASQYCGLHVHASNDAIGYKELIRLCQHMVTRQDLLFRFCKVIPSRISDWCEETKEDFTRVISKKARNLDEVKKYWYEYNSRVSNYHAHYDSSRYHNLNLHSFFEGKGIEYRLFNSTFDCDRVKCIIDLVQGFTMDAINSVEMRQYIHTDRTVYNCPDRMYTLLETYTDRMQLEPETKKMLLSENI